MKKQLHIFLFFLLIFTCSNLLAIKNSPQNDTINQFADGKRTGLWEFYGRDKQNSKGYLANQIIEKGYYKNGRKSGLWIKYYPNGNKKSEINYTNGRPNGKFKLYYENGNVEEEGEWVNRVYNGSFKRYYEDGTIEQEKEFNNKGKTTGKVVYYYPNGKKELEFTSENGKETGKAIRYYTNGDVKEIIEFDNGAEIAREEKTPVNANATKKVERVKLENKKAPKAKGDVNPADVNIKDGYTKRYNDNNDILMDGEFKNGKLWNGKWYKYDDNGLLLKIEIYKNGKYEGDGVIGM